jgi:hypothetical protein
MARILPRLKDTTMSLESFYWFPTVSTDWMEHAACRGMDPNLFVVSTTAEVKLAKRICNGAPTTRTDPGCPPCPVKAQCLEYCLSIPGPVLGVWGGTADRDRREIRRDRNPDGIRRRRHQHGTEYGYKLHMKYETEPCQSCKDAMARKSQAWRDRNRDASTLPALAKLLQLVGVVNRQGGRDGRVAPGETA